MFGGSCASYQLYNWHFLACIMYHSVLFCYQSIVRRRQVAATATPHPRAPSTPHPALMHQNRAVQQPTLSDTPRSRPPPSAPPPPPPTPSQTPAAQPAHSQQTDMQTYIPPGNGIYIYTYCIVHVLLWTTSENESKLCFIQYCIIIYSRGNSWGMFPRTMDMTHTCMLNYFSLGKSKDEGAFNCYHKNLSRLKRFVKGSYQLRAV